MPDRIKVLLLASDPFAFENPLKLDHEARAVTEAIRKGRARDSLDFVSEWAVRTGDLQHALDWHRPQVVHFAGHASASEGIFLEGGDGSDRAVSPEALRGVFALSDSVRVVVLNACESLATAEAFADVVDYTIGMNTVITDPAAALFAEAFYGALAMGRTVQDAFALGVNRLQIEGTGEAKTPTLHIRRGVDPTKPLIQPDTPPQPAPTQTASGGAVTQNFGSNYGSIGSQVQGGGYIIHNH
ncbi:MAG TPA: CHAT domain-containing protein [Longimicrobiaceae bacterium]